MNKLILIGLVLIVAPIVLAMNFVQDEIKSKALELKTPFAIEEWVEDNIVWTEQERLLAVEQAWTFKQGDCSEKARLKCNMMRYNAIPCRTVHGLANGGRHDWVEWKWKGKWSSMEASRFNRLTKQGLGVWT